MDVTLDTAKDTLPELIDAARAGEDVVISEGSTPVARLVPIEPPARKPFIIGIWDNKFTGPIPDFLEPMSEEDLALWEGRE